MLRDMRIPALARTVASSAAPRLAGHTMPHAAMSANARRVAAGIGFFRLTIRLPEA